jgi:PAS domain S-box-containing protein
MKEELEESRQMLEMVLDHVPGLVFWKNVDGVYLGCNTSFSKHAGLTSRNAIVGKCDDDLPWSGAQAEVFRCIDRSVIESGVPKIGYTETATNAEGRTVWFRMSKVPMIDAEGRIVGVLATAEDFSEERRIAEERELSRGLLETAIEQSLSGILVADAPNVTIRIANAAALSIRGDNPSRLTGIEVSDHASNWQTFRPDGTPYPSDQLPLSRAVLRGEATREENLIIRDQDGNDRWVVANSAPVRDSAGNVRAGIVVFHDVTDLKKAELEIRASEEKFRGIAERSSEIIYNTDGNGHVTYASPAVETILGYRPEEVLGRSVLDFVCEYDRQRASDVFERQMGALAPEHNRFHLMHKCGKVVTVEIHSSAIIADHEAIGMQGTVHDITAECEAEEKLKSTEAQMSHLARLSALGEMIAGIAHELNHPLYAIQNLAKACRNVLGNRPAEENGELADWCDKIVAAAVRAGAVVKNLREFSRRSEFKREPVGLYGILEETISLLHNEAHRYRVAMHLDREGPSPVVHVDRIRIEQVLVNLIRNACESVVASDRAERKVVVRSRTTKDYAVVSIIDNGLGLPGHLGDTIFEPFVTTKPEGLGLGLSVSTTILDGHDSRLRAFPNPQGGAIFQFQLPLAQ